MLTSKKFVHNTRSGYPKTVAEKIAGRLGGEPVEITLHGTVGPTDAVVLVSPLWAGKVIPAAAAFLTTVPRDLHDEETALGRLASLVP